MSNVFEVLKRMGGVVVENGVTYVTHPNPPANDDSQKIATTAWVKDITDALEASVSGGMFPKIQNATPQVWNTGYRVLAPSGGTWWVYIFKDSGNQNNNKSYSGGALIASEYSSSDIYKYLCIKIA